MAIYNGFTHKKRWISIVMLVYQRVCNRTPSCSILLLFHTPRRSKLWSLRKMNMDLSQVLRLPRKNKTILEKTIQNQHPRQNHFNHAISTMFHMSPEWYLLGNAWAMPSKQQNETSIRHLAVPMPRVPKATLKVSQVLRLPLKINIPHLPILCESRNVCIAPATAFALCHSLVQRFQCDLETTRNTLKRCVCQEPRPWTSLKYCPCHKKKCSKDSANKYCDHHTNPFAKSESHQVARLINETTSLSQLAEL